MKKVKLIIMLAGLAAVMLLSACHKVSKDDLIVIPGTEVPTAEVTGEATPEPSPSLEPSQEAMSSVTEVVTPSAKSATKGGINRLVFEGDRFELGNTVNSIFQAGTELANKEYHFFSSGSGLYEDNKQEYLTDYKVYNLNYFDGILYYTVDDNMNLSESRRSSRIEKYDLSTGEITILYSHPSKIGQMYCINNEFLLFLSRNKLYKKTIGNNSDAEEIVFSNSQIKGVPIFGLVPTKGGVILIGNKADNYSLFADGVLFKEHVVYVSVTGNNLILGIDGYDFKVDMEKLFERLDKWLEDGNAKPDDNNTAEFEIAGLMENCDLYPETTMSELFPDSPLWTQENNDADAVTPMPLGNSFITTPTPVVVPYEGIVVGRDVNDNELHMTQEEADRFVLEGNILKLYDGSWFDLDDDGEPEYISIRPYGEWSPGNSQNGEYPYEKYLVNLNGEDVDINRPDVWIDEKLYAVEISGYGIKFMEDSRADDLPWFSNGRTEQRDYCLYIISLDNQTKQVMIRTTMYGPADEMFSQPYVYRLDNKTLKGCGWLGCEVKDFTLEENQIYGAQIILRNVVLGPMVLKEKNHFDGQRIVSEIEGVDLSFYPERLKFNADTMILKIADEEGTITVNHGDELELVSIELLNPDSINQHINQTSLEYSEKYFVSGVYATSIEYFEKKLVCRLSFRIPETGEIGYVDEVDGELENCVTDVMGTSTYFYGFGKDP